MKCQKCKGDFSDIIWENGKIYNGIDEHHNPPKFLMKKWKGKIYFLCRKCHRELHDSILVILNQKAKTLKFVKSEDWVVKKMSPFQIKESCFDVYNFTEDWINNEVKKDDTNST